MARPKKKEPPIQPSGKCYAYLRVSTSRQGSSGLGIDAQDRACLAVAKRLNLSWGLESYESKGRFGFFIDIDRSAYKIPFDKRPGGIKLLEIVQPGDTVIAAKMCRLFRSMSDFVETAGKLTKMGVRLVLCTPNIDLASASGMAFAQHLAAFAEWESRRKGERIKAALESKRIRQLAEAIQNAQKDIPADETESLDSDWRPPEWAKWSDPEPILTGKVHSYIRCSHRDSADSELGLLAQARKAESYSQFLIDKTPGLERGEQFTDIVVSASKFPLRVRFGGKQLIDGLKPGDHIVFASLDRAFRDLADLTSQIAELSKKNVTVHFVDEGVDTSDSSGRMMAHFAGLFAEYEAELISQRCREARAENAGRGRYCGGGLPSFWTLYKTRTVKRLVVVKRDIACFRLINIYRSQGMSIKAACDRMEQIMAKREKRPAIPQCGAHRYSTIMKGLPKEYPKNERGVAFPSWHFDRYMLCKPNYDGAVLAWKKVKQLRRQAMSEVGPPAPLPKRKLNHRGWPIGDNPPGDKRKEFPTGDFVEE